MAEKIEPEGDAQRQETEIRERNKTSLNSYLNFLDSISSDDVSIDTGKTSNLTKMTSFFYELDLKDLNKEISLLAAIGGINEILEIIKKHSEDQDPNPQPFSDLFAVAYRAYLCGRSFASGYKLFSAGSLKLDSDTSYLKIMGRYFIELDISAGPWGAWACP